MKNILPFELSRAESDSIQKRLNDFQEIARGNNIDWFNELCFCILTSNAQAKKAIAIQEHVGLCGFLEKSENELATIIRAHNHRFHYTKARYIVCAREYCKIKDILLPMTVSEAREFIVQNILGLGYKEASHFLRNVGYSNVAIIDRHIVKFLVKYQFIKATPKIITKKLYLELELLLQSFDIPLDRLDLMIWYHMTGEILK